MKKVLVCLLLVLLAACGSTSKIPRQNLEKGVAYRRDMMINVNGKTFEGMGVIDSADLYNFHVETRGEIDLFILSSCNRDWTKEKAWNVKMKVKSGLFNWGRKLVDKKREIKFDYEPIEEIERTYCPIWLAGAEEKKGRHSWGFIDFRTADMILPARLECNGEVLNSKGVAACQSRTTLTQVVEFESEMLLDSYNAANSECKLEIDRGNRFEFQIRPGNCVYRFARIREPNLEYRLTTYGYRKILIRQAGEK